MKTMVLVFHPNISNSRVNRYLANTVETIDGVTVRYMYDLYPDFQIKVEQEQTLLKEADRIVLQFPMYWYSSPALLKQWEDDVLTHGWAYGSTGDMLKDKELLIAVTPGAASLNYVHDSNFKYTITDFLRPFQATSNLISTKFIKPFVVYSASSISDEELERRSKDYTNYLSNEHLEVLDDYE